MPERARIPVMEIMSKTPLTVPPDERVDFAASTMRTKGAGSLVVVSGGKPVGILTERDIVTKVAADNRIPSTLLVKDIMSSPLISISGGTEVVEAARRMAEKGIRRLAVVKGEELVGVVTENDILRVWPHLVEVTREYARAGLLDDGRTMEGHCEHCGLQASDLALDRGLWRCGQCRNR